MNDDQQKSISKNHELETSQELKAFAKALMVNITWKMAGLLKEEKSDPRNQRPPHSEG
jgi:hypothetical protein